MKPKLFSLFRASLALATLAPFFLSNQASANPISWDGSDSTAWALGPNWSGDLAPFNDLTTDIAVFNLATYTNQPDAGTTSIKGIQIGDDITATGALTLSGTLLSLGTSGIDMKVSAGAATISSPITLGAIQTWKNDSSSSLTISGAVGGAFGLTKTGTGALTLSGNNTNTGQTIVSGGSLIFDGVTWNSSLTTAASRNFNIGSGGSVEIKNNAQITLGGWMGLGYVNNTGAGVLTLTSGSLTVNGISGGNPSDRGLVLGEYSLSSTGTFNMNGGSLTVANAAVYLGQNSSGTWNMGAGSASVKKLAFGANSGSSGTLNLTGGTLTVGTGGITKGSSTATLNMGGGTLSSSASWSSSLPMNLTGTNGNLSVSTNHTITLSGALSGDGGLTKAGGTGTLTLSGTASHTGTTSVEAGTLLLSGFMETSPIVVKNGATCQVAFAGENVKSLALEDGSRLITPLDTSGSGYLYAFEQISFSGGTVIIAPIYTIAPAVGTYDFAVAEGGITGSASLVVEFPGSASSRITGTAAVVGNRIQVTIAGAGADLVWKNAAGTGIWNLNSDVNFLNGASNDVFKTYDKVTFSNTSPAGTVTLAGTMLPSEVTVNSSNDFSFAGTGSLSGAAILTKRGSGTLTISNTNSITGDTLVEEGRLTVNGALGTSYTTVSAGASLTGIGSIAGQVIVDGTIAPSGTGTLSTGALELYGTYQCDISGNQSDKLAVTGNLALDGATLATNFITPSTAMNQVIATYTGTRSGTFDAAPAGFELDYSENGKVVLWPTPVAPPAGTITFETDQGYPVTAEVAGTTADPNGAAFSGVDGWSLASVAGNTQATGSSGEYRGGQALGCANSSTFVSGRMGGIQTTGASSISFDAPFFTGTSVGFMNDNDGDGLFDSATESGMVFGFGGTPARIQYRNAGFGAEFQSSVAPGGGQWCHFNVSIGASVGGNRSITMTVRNLTTGTDIDFDNVTDGIQPWTFSVTDAQFGTAPELSDGVFIRATSSARIDNLRATSVNPSAGTAYDTWADSWTSPALSDKTPGGDPDHDGISNLMEYVIGGDPRVSSTQALPTQQTTGSNLVLSFKRSDASESDTTQKGQWSGDLVNWTDVTPELVNENGSDPDDMTVTIPLSNNVGGKLFGRIFVKQN